MKHFLKGFGALLLILAVYFGLTCLFTKSICVVFGLTFSIWACVFVTFVYTIILALLIYLLYI